MVAQDFPEFKRVFSQILMDKHAQAITDALRLIADDLGNDENKADIMKSINDSRLRTGT